MFMSRQWMNRSPLRACLPRRPNGRSQDISGRETASTSLYAKDNDGDENFNVYAVDPSAKPAAGTGAPSRDLTGLKGVRVEIFEVPKSDPDIVYIGLNDRDKAWHDLYRLKISTGEKTLIRNDTERITGWVFDLTGQLRMATRSAENGDTERLRVDADGFTKRYSCSVFETCQPLQFQPGDQL